MTNQYSNISKRSLGDYLETQCDRQLLLNLAKNCSGWLTTSRQIKELDRVRNWGYNY